MKRRHEFDNAVYIGHHAERAEFRSPASEDEQPDGTSLDGAPR